MTTTPNPTPTSQILDAAAPTPVLTNELTHAWAEKADRLAEKLRHMEHGFALFRPESVQQTRRELSEAIGWARFWARQR